MEDILASIRRILSDDEVKAEAPPGAVPEPAAADDDDVLMLDASMMVMAEQAVERASGQEPALDIPPIPVPNLVAPEAAAAAASSVDSLVRTLNTERSMMVTSQGPTIEDIVRQEIRPLLKAWLDVNLPPLVERLVRTEIEGVVGRGRT